MFFIFGQPWAWGWRLLVFFRSRSESWSRTAATSQWRRRTRRSTSTGWCSGGGSAPSPSSETRSLEASTRSVGAPYTRSLGARCPRDRPRSFPSERVGFLDWYCISSGLRWDSFWSLMQDASLYQHWCPQDDDLFNIITYLINASADAAT